MATPGTPRKSSVAFSPDGSCTKNSSDIIICFCCFLMGHELKQTMHFEASERFFFCGKRILFGVFFCRECSDQKGWLMSRQPLFATCHRDRSTLYYKDSFLKNVRRGLSLTPVRPVWLLSALRPGCKTTARSRCSTARARRSGPLPLDERSVRAYGLFVFLLVKVVGRVVGAVEVRTSCRGIADDRLGRLL